MKHKKNMYVPINPWDRRRMVKFLEAQAEKGWMFCGFAEKLWQFRLIEPKKVHFSVVYFPADFEKDTSAVPRLLEFREFCAHDGWELAGADRELQVFYSLKENPMPIETDPVLEVQTMQAAALRKHSPTLKRDVGMSIVYILFGLYAWYTNPVRLFLSTFVFLPFLIYGGGLLEELVRIGEQFLWLFRAKRYVARYGEYPHKLKRTCFSKLVGMATGLAFLGITAYQMGIAVTIYLAVSVLLVVYLMLLGLRWLDKQFFTSGASNLIRVTLLVVILVGGVLLAIKGRVLLNLDQPRYAPYGSHWAQYEEVPPLRIEEYYGEEFEKSHYYSWVEETPFLAKYEGSMDAERGEDWVELDYEVLEVKWEALYDACLADYINGRMKGSCVYVDAAPWGAEMACYRGSEENPTNLWLLCYENRIVLLYVSEDPTPEQMALIGETFG